MQINVNVNISLSRIRTLFFPFLWALIEQERYKEGTLGSWFLIPSDDDAWLDKEKDRHLITTTT